MRPASVAAAIPAYRASATVGAVVAGTLETVAEVLVVDDGSSDGTGDAARRAGARVVSHAENRGKGRALATAFADLVGRGHAAVVTLDADGQHLPEEIPRLVTAWGGEDGGAGLVIGSRDHLYAEMSAVRRLSNRISSALISLAAGLRLRDTQSGFRLYDRRLLAAVDFPEARFEAESAVIVRAARAGFRVIAVPVRLGFVDGRATSHYRPLIDSARIARAVIRARLEGAR